MAYVAAEGSPQSTFTGIEEVLQFTSPPLHEYLNGWGVRSRHPSHLISLAEAMAAADHPIVRYAAGWAMADVAFQPKTHTSIGMTPYELRVACLGRAHRLWDASIPLLDEAYAATPHSKAEYDAYAIRARWACACVPSMHIEAAWRGGQTLPYDDVIALVRESHSNALQLGIDLLGRDWSSQLYRRKFLGIMREIVATVALQDDFLFRFIGRPASLRHDHHFEMGRRADIIATAVEAGHKTTPIQVDSTLLDPSGAPLTLVNMHANTYVLNVRAALVTDVERSAPLVMKAFLAKEYACNPDPAVVGRLGSLSSRLAADLARFQRMQPTRLKESDPVDQAQ